MLFLSLISKYEIAAIFVGIFLMVFSYTVRKPLVKENKELKRELNILKSVNTNSMYGMSERAKYMKYYVGKVRRNG